MRDDEKQWNWGDESEVVDDTQTENALKNVIKVGRARKQKRRTAMAGASVFALIVATLSVTATPPQTVAAEIANWFTPEPDPTTTLPLPTTSTAPPVTFPSVAVDRPETMVALVAESVSKESPATSRVVVLDSKTGSEIRTLAKGVLASTVELSSDGKTVFFDNTIVNAKTGETCTSISSVATAGGKSTVIVKSAKEPSISPDGKELAFVNSSCSKDEHEGQDLGVYSLTNKSSKIIAKTNSTLGGTMPSTFFNKPVWTSDGNFVISNSATYPATGSVSSSTHAYDVRIPNPVNYMGDVTSKELAAPGFGEERWQWTILDRMPDGKVVGFRTCCEYRVQTHAGLVVANGGNIEKMVIQLDPQTQVVNSASISPDGKHLAYVLRQATGMGELWLHDEGAERVRIPGDFVSVKWR